MIVICEECGKKYRVDPAKIKGRAASFQCRVCEHQIIVSKPDAAPAKPSSPGPLDEEPAEPEPAAGPSPDPAAASCGADDEFAAAISANGATRPKTSVAATRRSHKAGRFGLRAKMLMLFLFIPMIFMTGAGLFFLWQFEATTNLLAQESRTIVNRMAEEKIAALSIAAATQCELYLLSHPELLKVDFNTHPGFRSLAVQKVGLTGYTALYEQPGPDGVWRTWAHSQSTFIAGDMSRLQQHLGQNFTAFWKIYTGVKGGRQSRGYYTGQDKDARLRDKFMVCTPIGGTRFVIAASAYLDEFTGPLRMMTSRAAKITKKVRIVTLTILGAVLLLSGLIVSLYGNRLSGKIKSLSAVADLISAGEAGRKIETRSKDEIGDLAEAIARVQDRLGPLKNSAAGTPKII